MPQWHALVIGVDRYPAFPSRQLSGCVNDAEAMGRFLVEKVRIPDTNLRRLLSPRQESDPATRATAANIRGAFDATMAAVAAGDHLVLYCAGHGIRIERAASGGAKDRHYGFVPEDVAKAATGFANLILGCEIYQFLRAIEQKGATATVIADTCHSGGATRGIEDEDEVAARSLEIDPLSDDEFDHFVAEHPALRSSATRAMVNEPMVTPFGGYAGGDFVMLTGCLDSETAKEHKEAMLGADGQPVKVSHGLMTHTLLKELERESSETIRSLRWMDLHARLQGQVAQRAAPMGLGPQTPVLEGRPEKTVFGGEWQPFDPGFTVRRDDAGTLTVDAGSMHGFETGASIAIYPPDTCDLESATGAEAVIASASAATSVAVLTDTTQHVADRSRARLVRPSPAITPIVVRLHEDAQPLPDAVRDALFDGSADGHFTVSEEQPSSRVLAHAELRRDRDGWMLLNTDRFGAPTTESPTECTPDNVVAYFRSGTATDSAMGAAMARGVACWADYVRARDHRAVDDTLKPILDVKLRISRTEMRPADMDTLAVVEPTDGRYVITDDDWLWAEIRVKKDTALRLQIGWLALSDDGNVLPLWPPQGADNSFATGDVVYVGRNREEALPLAARADQSVSMWTLKVIACTVPQGAAPLNIWGMAQSSVQEVFDGAIGADGDATRGALRPTGAPAVMAEQPAWYAWDFRIAVNATTDANKEMKRNG
jgi:hypothetical protein